MRQPTWQEIEAEAQRRGKLDFDNTGRSWTLAEKIVEVMNEGWTPPDPRREAYLQWRDTVGPTVPFENAFYAGADWGEKRALDLLAAREASGPAVKTEEAELALDTLGPVEALRDALKALPPRPHIRPFPREARANVIGWGGRHKTEEVFFIPLNAWKRLFKTPWLAARAAAAAMNARADRFAQRAERARALLEQALTIADLKKVERPAATLSLSNRAPRLIVMDESAIPSRFWEAPPPRLNKRGVAEALKAGEPVPGVSLSNAAPTLTMRIN